MRLHPTLLLALCSLASCATVEKRAAMLGLGVNQHDPTVVIHGPGGSELGVSTEYGIVFLGRGARGGSVPVEVWFADGMSLEDCLVEPIGGGLYTAEAEIILPTAPISFDAPRRGRSVTVVGRRGGERWESETSVTSHPQVSGLLLRLNSTLSNLRQDQIGAGVYVGEEGDRALLGLVSGRLRLETETGVREFLTVVGPRELWRVVSFKRNVDRRRRWVYREDIL
jgi:hypothetical protein